MKWKDLLVSFILLCGLSFSCAAQNSDKSKKSTEESSIIYGYIPHCYSLTQNAPVKIVTPKNKYQGRVVVHASIDTTTNSFNNYKVVFAKLKAKNNPNDSIEIRPENKVGDFQYVMNYMPQIIQQIQNLKLKKVDSENCTVLSGFIIPIIFE